MITQMGLWVVISVFIVWSAIWKGIGLWKSGRNGQLSWFVWMFILNTAGILPILYLAYFQKESKEARMLKRLKK